MNLHVHERTPAGTPGGTVLFLHGFPFDGSMWSPQLDALRDDWHGLAPDLRGFGGSGLDSLPGEVSTGKRIGNGIARGSEPVLTMARMADDVAELITDQANGPAVVCGLSMGGYVAFELWRRQPQLVRGLILADTRAGADDDEAREARLRMAQTARTSGSRVIAAAMVPSLLSSRTLDESPELAGRVRDMILGTPPETVIAALAGMTARHDMNAELPRITVPTLVVAGEHDEITPVEGARDMAAAIPDATFEEIPGAGHLSNMENPKAFNEAMGRFLLKL